MIRFTHMKKWLTITLANLIAFVSLAQETAEETYEPENYFSDDMQRIMLIVFAIAVIILVLRTFRNKPEV